MTKANEVCALAYTKGQMVKERFLRKRTSNQLLSTKGEGYIDTVFKILIAVVLGVLLMIGLSALMNSEILPALSKQIKGIFTGIPKVPTGGYVPTV
ncbi:MAG: DUF6133 family protein [Clostridiales bacterium]